MRKQIALKIAKKVHVSTSTAIVDYLPMFEELMKNQAAELALQFEFDEDELEFFNVLAPKKVIEQGHEIKAKAIAEEKSVMKDEKQKGLDSFF
jgi:hypothetical protein